MREGGVQWLRYRQECFPGGTGEIHYYSWQTLQIPNKTPILVTSVPMYTGQNKRQGERDASEGLSNIYSTDIIYRSTGPLIFSFFLSFFFFFFLYTVIPYVCPQGFGKNEVIYKLYTNPPVRPRAGREAGAST